MKKSLALVARKKLVAQKKSASYSKMAKSMHDQTVKMEQMRLAAKPKPAAKKEEYVLTEVRYKHPGHGNQAVHDPKTGGVGARVSAARNAFAKRAKKAAPFVKAAAAGALEGTGSIATGMGITKLLSFRPGSGRGKLATAAGTFLGGRGLQQAGAKLGRQALRGVRGRANQARLIRLQNTVRTGVKFGYSGTKLALGAYRYYRANQPTINAAVRAFMGKEVRTKGRKASYDQLRDEAVQAFRAAYPYTEGGTYRYVCEVFPDYMIVDEAGKYYKADYDSGEIAPRSDWEEVAKVTEWETKEFRAGLTVFKEGDNYRWVLLSSNGFRDRDGEIVATKALEHDVALWDLQDQPPSPLRWWHVSIDDEHQNGLDLGYTDFRMMHNHTLIESGTFIAKEVGESVYNGQDKLAASIGFRHSPKEPDSDKIFNTVRIFERSLLPKESASNPLTHLVVTD